MGGPEADGLLGQVWEAWPNLIFPLSPAFTHLSPASAKYLAQDQEFP